MIEKRVGIMVSGGRTGTAFFGRFLGDLIDDCWSVHEPDVWIGWRHRRSWNAIRWFGLHHAVLGKIAGRTGMRIASERYLTGRWSRETTIRRVIRQRQRFYGRREESLILESNAQWFGLMTLLPDIFRDYRVAAVVRDPRTWVPSWLAHGGRRDARDRLGLFRQPRLEPMDVGETVDNWESLGPFERLCWDWRFINSLLLDASQRDQRIRLFRYEDLLVTDDRTDHQEELLEFLTSWPDRRYGYRHRAPIFERRVNASAAHAEARWHTWSEEGRAWLRDLCGGLMIRLGYDIDD